MKFKKKRAALAVFLLIILPIIAGCGKKDSDAVSEDNSVASGETADVEEKEKTEIEKTETEKTEMEFPYELEEGKLLVNSLFQSSIENPDCGNEIGEDIASVEIINQSEEFCVAAEIDVTMQDGTELTFHATNIPAGKTGWAFALDNQTIAQESVCEKIESTAEFGEASVLEDEVVYTVEDTTITIQNITENEITDLSVYCHCLFEDVYFGGLTYCYPVESLSAGESVVIEADDCYMGTAEVVCIRKNN